jgi:hypothetical protein
LTTCELCAHIRYWQFCKGIKNHTVMFAQIVSHQILHLFLLHHLKNNIRNDGKSPWRDFNDTADRHLICRHPFPLVEILDVLRKVQSDRPHLVLMHCCECFGIHSHLSRHIFKPRAIRRVRIVHEIKGRLTHQQHTFHHS